MLKTALLATSALALASASASASTGNPPPAQTSPQAEAGPIACDLHALTAEQRARHMEMSKKLLGSGKERRALDSGWALRVDEVLSLPDLGEWLDAEHRCCPFLELKLVVEPRRGPVWVHMTGPAGTKEFLKAAFEG